MKPKYYSVIATLTENFHICSLTAYHIVYNIIIEDRWKISCDAELFICQLYQKLVFLNVNVYKSLDKNSGQ